MSAHWGAAMPRSPAKRAALGLGGIRRPHATRRQTSSCSTASPGQRLFPRSLSYFSPYARLTWTLDDATELDSPTPRGTRGRTWPRSGAEDAELQRDLNTLGLFPRISMRDGRARSSAARNTKSR